MPARSASVDVLVFRRRATSHQVRPALPSGARCGCCSSTRTRLSSGTATRSNVFSMIKRKHGGAVRAKHFTAQRNELLCKMLCHNLCVLVASMNALGIAAEFGGKPRCPLINTTSPVHSGGNTDEREEGEGNRLHGC